MKKVAVTVVLVVAIGVLALGSFVEPVNVFSLFDWHVTQKQPVVNYPVLAVSRVIDGDSFEFWLHIAPRLAYFADIRLANVDTPEITGDCKEEGLRVKGIIEDLFRNAEAITVKFTGYVSFGRWVCIVTVDGQDLAWWVKEKERELNNLWRSKGKEITYSLFRSLVGSGQVLTIMINDNLGRGTMVDGAEFLVQLPNEQANYEPLLLEHGVSICTSM